MASDSLPEQRRSCCPTTLMSVRMAELEIRLERSGATGTSAKRSFMGNDRLF
jgi:hypothetical protein